MKLPTDLVRMYREVHGWVGIISGLALFIAFYAGALTMFEVPLQRWASAPVAISAPPALDRTPELVGKVLAAHPAAAAGYEITLAPNAARPARMSWLVRQPGGAPGEGQRFYASLGPDGGLEVVQEGPSEVAQLIDILHQQVGLPFAHEISMPIMGAIALLYTVALVSGLVVLLPSLISDLFALRIGCNVKRMWLDLHNVLGLFSLPFHLIMAFTAVVFAFHDQFYAAQEMALASAPPPQEQAHVAGNTQPLSPAQIVRRLEQQAPGFTPQVLAYHQHEDGIPELVVQGSDPRYGLRAPTYGMAGVDPFTGTITATDYMPGLQDGWSATVTSFFALHFGNFGGDTVRWAYFLLGLAGAGLFYTGNLLWVETRRKKERKAGLPEQTRATCMLGSLTVGVPLGCIAGIALTLAAARLLPAGTSYGLHSAIYYAAFLAMTGWALLRGAARSGVGLSLAAALASLCVPAASLCAGRSSLMLVDLAAIIQAGWLVFAARKARARAAAGPRDSVWSFGREEPA